MSWSADWTVDNVAQNFIALGKAGVDPEDIIQLIEDSRELDKLREEYADLKFRMEGLEK